MKIFRLQYLMIALAFVFGITTTPAQEQTPTKTIKRVPVTDVHTIDGQVLFDHYCAACHGQDLKGTGPAADALKKAPADLTQIARKSGGSFPEVHVMRVIKGDDLVGAHGSRDMPIWGELFTSLSGKETTELRVNALMKYLEKMQAR